MQTQAVTELTPHVAVINGAIKTTSIVVASHFGKRHDNVIKAIKALDCSPEFHALNFEEMQIEVEIGNNAKRMSPAYEMTKDGFTFLAMGFTGKEAAKWKEAYINAFNAMAEQLSTNPLQLPEPKTQKALPNGLTLEMQDCVKTLVKERVAALPKDKQGAAAVKCWSSIKKKFGKSYKAVEPEHFSSIISLLGRLPLEGELMPKEETVTNTSLTITLAPLQPGEIMKRWLITHHGNDMVQMWAVKPDTEVKQRDHFIHDLKTDGYLVIKKDEFSIGNFVMEQVPYTFLPVLIETAGKRLRAIDR